MQSLNGVSFALQRFVFTASEPNLFIILHGGGGAPSELNDAQHCCIQKRYFRVFVEHRLDAVVVYPRGFGDTWDMHFRPESYGFYRALIALGREQYHVARVYLLGYSAGADGCWNIGACMSDCFDGICACCGHPNGVFFGNLGNFVQQAGEDDDAYGRNAAAAEYAKFGLKTLIHSGKGHQINDYEDAPQETTAGTQEMCSSVLLLCQLAKQRSQRSMHFSFASHAQFALACSEDRFLWAYQLGIRAESNDFWVKYSESADYSTIVLGCSLELVRSLVVIELDENITCRYFHLVSDAGDAVHERFLTLSRESAAEVQAESAKSRIDAGFAGFGVYFVK